MKLGTTLIILFSVIVFAGLIPNKAWATWSYIQVQIARTSGPGGSFSLPAGTVVSIWDGAEVLATITTTSPVSTGGVITSGLVDLTDGLSYTLRVETRILCDGTSYNGSCWYKGSADQSCNQVCSTKGGTKSTTCCESAATDLYDTSLFSSFGISCPPGYYYSEVCPASYHTYYSECRLCYNHFYGACDCSLSNPYTVPLCACKGQMATFNFTFTAEL